MGVAGASSREGPHSQGKYRTSGSMPDIMTSREKQAGLVPHPLQMTSEKWLLGIVGPLLLPTIYHKTCVIFFLFVVLLDLLLNVFIHNLVCYF